MELSRLFLLTSLAISALTTLGALAPRSRANDQPRGSRYQDRDGESTPEAAAAFSNTTPKAFVLISSLFGLAASLAVAVLNQKPLSSAHIDAAFHNWIPATSWMLLLLQALCLVRCRDSVKAYNLAACLALAALGWGLASLSAATFDESPAEASSPIVSAIEAMASFATIALALACVSLPRRPAMLHRDHAVDGMLTTLMLSRMTWNWAWGLPMYVEAKRVFETDDIPWLPHWLRARFTAERWRASAASRAAGPMWWRIVRLYRRDIALQWALSIVKSLLSIGSYYATLNMIRIIETLPDGTALPRQAWLLVPWICFFILVGEWLEQYVHWLGWGELNNQIRAQFPALIFEKLMRRKNVTGAPAKAGTGTGTSDRPGRRSPDHDLDDDKQDGDDGSGGVIQTRKAIQHLVASDALRIALFFMRHEQLSLSTGRLVVSLAFLVQLLGWVPIGAGLLSWMVLLPLGVFATRRFARAQTSWVKVRDRKQTIVDEMIHGIRQLKFSALEPDWERQIGVVREEELGALWHLALARTMNFAFWLAGPVLLATTSLAVYAVIHGRLLPSVTFVSVLTFRNLESALSFIPDFVNDFISLTIASRRVDTHLCSPELDDGVTTASDVLAVEHATVAWPVDNRQKDEEDRFVLTDVTVVFPTGELSIISGGTGSGKSLLLAALLAEVDLLSGIIRAPVTPSPNERRDDRATLANWILPGAKALVGQTPWVENATVEENILFGLPMEPARYQQTLAACALLRDLKVLSDGEQTELGVNSINLSGGQKWRVSLARAVYSRAGILIMDDIFSAVDAHVGKHLLEHCIGGSLCRGRTIVMATHHLDQCLSRARLVVELGGGTVKSIRTMSDRGETAISSDVGPVNGGAEANVEADVELPLKAPASSSTPSCARPGQ